MNNASLGKNAKFYCGRLFFAKPAFLWFCRQYVISEKSSLTLQSLVCLHRRVFLLCPPLLDYGFIDNEKCFTMCVQIKLIRHRKKKRHVEKQKKIAKDVAAM